MQFMKELSTNEPNFLFNHAENLYNTIHVA